MTQFYTYQDPFGSSAGFSVALGNEVIRLGDLGPLVEMAEHLQAGSSTVTFDDPDADLGNAGDAILGMSRLIITETACPSGNRRLYSGFFGTRTYSRRPDTSLLIGASRQVVAELHDLNALLSLRVIPNSDRAAIRPAETVTARMAWFMASNYRIEVVDGGFVAPNSTMMTKTDYRGQRGANVVNDCEMAAGFGWNAFVYFDEALGVPALYFDNANTATNFTSTLRFSNVLADLDAFTDPAALTFAPAIDAELRRDPTDLGSGVYLPYQNSAVYRTRADTILAYGKKDIIAPNSNVTTKARATDQADDFLWQHHTEEDRITVTVELPPSHVNLIRAGHRVQVRFQHLPGYEAFRWCRVLSRAPGQTKETDDRYWVRLELSPQELPCAESVLPTFTQAILHDETLTWHDPEFSEYWSFASPTTLGNLLVFAVMSPLDTNASVVAAPTGWHWAVQNEPNELVGGNYCNVFWKVSEGEQTVSVQFLDTDGNRRVAMVEYAGLNNPVVFGTPTVNLQDPGVGFGTMDPTSYPAGPTAVVGICFMGDGPTGTDDVFIDPAGATLRTPIDGGLHGVSEVAIADRLLDTTAGSQTWNFGNTGGGPTLTIGIAFEGSSCV